jgi:sigma-B regulation protein RsbU (phosphoserine phosphatase)
MAAGTGAAPSRDDRHRGITAAADLGWSQLDVAGLLGDVLDTVCQLLRVDTAVVLLIDPRGQELAVAAARGFTPSTQERVRFGEGFAGRVAAARAPQIVHRVDAGTGAGPSLLACGVRSLLAVPLVADGSVLGVLHVGSRTAGRFTQQDAALLRLAADRLAVSLHGRLSAADLAAAAALQRSLLPSRLPAVAGLELAARFVPADAGGVGGDWYDVFSLPGGQLGVVMGDVAGRGLPAAVVMGRLRSALRAYALLERTDPAEVLTRLNNKVLHFEPGILATVLYATIDLTHFRAQVSLAGHPAPILANPGEPTRPAALPVDPPIGVRPGPPRRTTTIDLRPGSVLCLYTDGLTERRGQDPDAELPRLCRTIASGPADTVCGAITAEFVGPQTRGDDVAILTLHRLPTRL